MAAQRSQIRELVKSVQKFSGFRQMAEYNMTCLLSHITPPAMGWRENVQTAIEDGGVEAIIHVLSKHPDALDMVKSSTTALTGMCISKKNAGEIAEKGGIKTALDSMLNIPDTSVEGKEVVESGAKLLETVARYNADAIAESSGSVHSILKGLNFDKNARVQAASAKVLDRIAMKKSGEDMIVQQNGIEMMISAIAPGKETDEAMLNSTFRLLERLAKNKDYVIKIRELGGVEAVVSQLEAHSDNEYILRAGGRLLAKIADDDIAGTINRLQNANLPPETAQFLMGLIANLALQPDKIEEIVKNDGINVILKNMHNYNPKTKAAALRAIQRVAESSKDNAQNIVDAGGLPILVGAIEKSNGDEDILKAATGALMAIAAAGPDFAALVDQNGGVEAVLAALNKYPDLDGFGLAALEFLKKVADSGYDISKLLKNGAVPAILESMKAHPENAEIQAAGFNALNSLMSSNDEQAAAAEITRCNGPMVMVDSLKDNAHVDKVVKAGIGAIAKYVQTDANGKKNIVSRNGIEALVISVFTQLQLEMLGKSRLSHDSKYTRDVRSLLSVMIESKEVAAVAKALSSPNETTLKKAAVYAIDQGFANVIMKSGAAKSLETCINGIINQGDTALLEIADVSVWSLAKSGYENAVDMIESGAVDSILKGIKTFPDVSEASNASLRCLLVFASSNDCQISLSDKGVIETTVIAMRSNGIDPNTQLSAVELLLALSSNEKLAAKVAYKGGVKQANAMMMNSSTSVEFEKAIGKSLVLIHKIATSNNNSKMLTQLKKQGTVDAVTIAMSAFPTNEEIIEYGARILSLLMDKEDVANIIDDISNLKSELMSSKRPEQTEKVFNNLAQKQATAGFLALNPENKDVFEEKNATAVIMSTVDQSVNQKPSNARQAAVKNGFSAFSKIAAATTVPNGTSNKLTNYLKADDERIAQNEKIGVLQAIKTLADLQPCRNEYLKLNTADDIVRLLGDNRNDEAFALAALGALRGLMADTDGAIAVSKAGGLDNILDLLTSNNDSMGPKLAGMTLDALGDLTKAPGNVDALMDGGIIDAVNNTLDNQCSDPADPQPEVLKAAAQLLIKLGEDEDKIREIVNKKAFEKIVNTAMSNPTYLGDADTMEAIAFLTESCSMVDDVRDKVAGTGAVDMIITAMNLNPDREDLNAAGSQALKRLMGGNNKGIEQTLKEYDHKLDQAKKNPKKKAVVQQLITGAQGLSNLMLIDGVVNADAAGEIVKRAMDTIDVANKKIDGPQKSALLESALQAIGRAANIDGALDKMDVNKAIDAITKGLRDNKDDPMVLLEGLKALNQLLNDNPALITSMAAAGTIAEVEKIINSSTNPDVVAAAEKTMQDMRDAGAQNAQSLLNGKNADESLIAMLNTAPDTDSLDKLLAQIAASPGGLDHLLDLLNNPNLLNKMDILDKLIDRTDGKINIPASMLPALLEKIKEGDERALRILGNSNLSPVSAQEIAKNTTAADVSNILKNAKRSSQVADALRAIAAMASNPELANQLMDQNIIEELTRIIQENPDNEEIQKAAIEALSNLNSSLNPGQMNITPETLAMIEKALNGLDSDTRAIGKKLIDDITKDMGGDVSPLVINRFDDLLKELGKDNDWKVLMDPKTNKPYYYNEKTGETSWTKPAALAAVDNIADDLNKFAENAQPDLEYDKLEAVTTFVGKHNAEPLRLKALVKALAALAGNESNRDAMAKAGVLKAIIKAMNGKDTDREFLLAAISLLNQFAKKDEYKEQIRLLKGIPALIAIMIRYKDDEEIVEKCLMCLSNLAHGSPSCTAEIMEHKGPKAVKTVLRDLKTNKILTNAMVLLSNCMHKNEDNKMEIGELLWKNILYALRLSVGSGKKEKDKMLFDKSAKALGNICFIDEHIFKVCGENVIKTLVSAMNAFEGDISVQNLAIEVMFNIAQADEDDIQDDIDSGKTQSVLRTIEHEGGARKIMDTFRETTEPSLLMTCIKTLSILTESELLIAPLIKMGVATLSLDAMQEYDYDEGISKYVIELVKVITEFDIGIDAVEAHDGVSILTQRLEAEKDDPENLEFITNALKNMAKKASVRRAIFKQGGVSVLRDAMNSNRTEKEFLTQAFELLSRLSINDEEISIDIAEKTMHVILSCIHKNARDPEVLTSGFQTLGHLAFTDANLKTIVQYGGVKLVLSAILEYPKQKKLVLQSVKTLDNIASASSDQADIVIKESGGKVLDAIRLVKEVYQKVKNDYQAEEIVNACKDAELSLTQIKKKPVKKRLFEERHALVDPSKDPLEAFRNLLKQGSVFTDWSSGSAKKRHLTCSKDMQALVFKDPAKGKVIVNLPLKEYRGVRNGIQIGHKKKANAATALAIVGSKKTYYLEATNEQQKNQWVAALQALHQTFRTARHWLK